jgi:hypothetical protein
MQESHRKGVAIHPDPESCVVAREGAIEALTGAHAGRVLSCEIIATGVPTLFSKAEGHTRAGATASRHATPRSLRPLACIRGRSRMQQSCTYGSVRGAPGQPASLPRQNGARIRFAHSSVGVYTILVHAVRLQDDPLRHCPLDRVWTPGFADDLSADAWRGDINGRQPKLTHRRR